MRTPFHPIGVRAATRSLLLAALCAAPAAAAPSIDLISVPAYGSTADLTGRVAGVNTATHGVAVYIFVGGWWNKPTFAAPLSPIGTNGTWTCDITTGGGDPYATQIAAYLVPTSYAPPLVSGWAALPDELESSSLARVRFTRPYLRQFAFSGYDWSVKDSGGQRTGPGDNYFSDSTTNAWVDGSGRLHLKISRRSGRWTCAEVVSQRSFGHGTYRVFLDSAADALDTNVVLGLFTWNDDAPYAHREIDVEVARWGSASDTNNAQFVVQPWDQPGHLMRYRVPPSQTNSTHSITWRTNGIDFVAHAGRYEIPPATNAVIASWTFSGAGVPPAGGENYRMNLWLMNTNGTTDGLDEEVVVSRFVFVPDPLPEPAWDSVAVVGTSGGLTATATSEPQLTCTIEVSTNLVGWDGISTLTATSGAVLFTDTNPPPRRFYRLAIPAQ